MPLIKSNFNKRKITIHAQIDSEILKQIYSYCKWANIKSIDIFFEESIKFILEKKKLK